MKKRADPLGGDGRPPISAGSKRWRRCKGNGERRSRALDSYIYKDVERRLMTQARDAKWWQDACLLYFASLNGRPWPSAARPPIHTLEELNAIKLPISNYECPPPPMLDSVR